MAGLLDYLGTPEGQGLLSAAFGGLAGARRGQPLNSLGRAGLSGLSGYADATDRQTQADQLAKRNQLFDFQLRAAQGAETDRATARARELSAQQAMIQQLTPVSAIDANSASGITGPRPEALAVVGQTPAFNARTLIARGVPTETVKSLAESPNWGRAKLGTDLVYRDDSGNEVTQQRTELGDNVGLPMRRYHAPITIDQGPKLSLVDPDTGIPRVIFAKSATPDAQLSAGITQRGQDITANTAANRLAFDRENTGGVEYKTDGNGDTFAVPTKPKGSGPIQPTPVNMPNKNTKNANDALAIIDEAKALIPDATGSYLGTGADQAARVFGFSTDGAQSTAKLKALEGALMLKQPRMEGPQSDKDAALYRQMAGQIGDPTVPNETKLAALDAIRAMHERYAGIQRKVPTLRQPAPGSTVQFDQFGNMVFP